MLRGKWGKKGIWADDEKVWREGHGGKMAWRWPDKKYKERAKLLKMRSQAGAHCHNCTQTHTVAPKN